MSLFPRYGVAKTPCKRRYCTDICKLKLREIAQITGLPLRTVQSRLRAALKTLKMQLEKEDWR